MSPKIQQGDLLKGLRFFHYFCIIAGLAPYDINSEGIIQVNKKSLVQTLIAFIHGVILLYLIQTYDVVEVEGGINEISVNTNVTTSYFWRFLSVMYIIFEFNSRHKLVKVFRKLQKLENKFLEHNFVSDIKVYYKRVSVLIYFGIIYIILSAIAVLFLDEFYTLYESMAQKSIWISFGLYFIMLFIMPLAILKIMIVNCIVKQRFLWINLALDKFNVGDRKVS